MHGGEQRGSYEITDAQIVRMTPQQQDQLERELQRVSAMNPQLLVTVTRDLLKRSVLVEWEPRDPSTVREP